MISTSRPAMTGALWTLCAAAFLDPVAALAQRNAPPQNIVVDATPSHAVSSFSPFRSLGAGIDRLRGDITDKVMTSDFIQKIQSAGWQTVSYRQNTELFAEAWHWNPKGKWSNASAKEGYFVGDALPAEMIRHSWAAPLPHRERVRARLVRAVERPERDPGRRTGSGHAGSPASCFFMTFPLALRGSALTVTSSAGCL